ncbi:MAG: DUF4062 domain-containing protein [Phycisphaerae bacterium]|nr:DUF4062 domain-containing protein [Phycisphaerae bacterium]
MSYQATVYKVMIASPSDVQKERDTAREVVNKWNDLHSEDKGIVLLPIGWETHTAPEMGAPPQAIIDKQILAGADLLVAVFLHRLGTPTLDAQSGTAHEIDSHVDSGKPAMIYFLADKVEPSEFDKKQYDKLMAFKNDMKKKGLLHECKRKDFESHFLDHLTTTINKNKYFQTERLELAVTNFVGAMDTDEVVLTVEARTLLLEAVNDRNGRIVKSSTMGGTEIQTNGKNLIPEQNPRIVAKWIQALEELSDNGFAEDVGYRGEVFAVTHRGYEYADTLKKEGDVSDDVSSGGTSASVEEDDLEFEKASGTYVSKDDGLRYCPKCLHSSPSERVPLQEGRYGWRCSGCDKFYNNPNRERQRHADNDYDRSG